MNLSYKFIILLALFSSRCLSEKTYKFPKEKFGNPLAKLLSSILIDFYSENSIEVDITRSAEDQKNQFIQSGILNEVLCDVNAKIPVRLEDYKLTRERYPRIFNIFIVDSYQSFRRILYTNKTDAFDYRGFYTVVLTSLHQNYTELVRRILQDCWDFYIINVNVITYDPSDSEKAFMYTYFPYTPDHCGKVKPIIYEIFSKEFFRKKNEIFPDKVGNFYGCNLTIGTFDFPPYMMIHHLENGTLFSGFEGVVTRVLGKRLHFSLTLKTCNDRWGRVEGENSTGLSGMILRGEINFTLGAFSFSFSHYGMMDSSIPYHATPLTLLVPPGKPYTPMQKLLLPLRYIIWSCLGACFVISAIVVSFAKILAPHRRTFIFGPGNHYPFINTINVFLGGSLSVVPRRNFARYILILWIFMSLVIRSSYQGTLFSVNEGSEECLSC
uniref:Putative ionotropic receptor ligand binding domain-containing protein n=1 Tax=Lutzomyia longipalpis TaxID=7200 RepID=A0A3F2ZDG0_LUTLO